MKLKRILKVVLIIMCGFSAVSRFACSAATYYVSTNGVNSSIKSNPEEAFRTINYATSMAQAGDTVFVKSGDYGEWVTTMINGESRKPVYFVGEPGTRTSGFRIMHHNINISGFEINGVDRNGAYGAIQLENNVSNVSIANCIFTGSGNTNLVMGIKAVYSNKQNSFPANITVTNNQFFRTDYMAMQVRGSNWNIGNNTFGFLNGWDAIRMQGQAHWIHDNVFTNVSNMEGNGNHVDLIHAFGANNEDCFNILIERNIAINCGNQGIRCEPQGNMNFNNWVVRNNLFINQGAATLMLGGWNCSVMNNTFWRCTRNTAHPLNFFGAMITNGISVSYNNIFVGCGLGDGTNPQFGFYTAEYWNSVDADYNFVCGAAPEYKRKSSNPLGNRAFNFIEVHGLNGGDPRFVNEGANYRPLSDSPAAGTGLNLSMLFKDDLTQKQRNILWDIGALIARPTNTAIYPSAPKNLKLGG